MKIGVVIPTFDQYANHVAFARIVQALESLDFDSAWFGDHVIFPHDHPEYISATWMDAVTCAIMGLVITSTSCNPPAASRDEHSRGGFVDHPLCIGDAQPALEERTMTESISRRRLIEVGIAAGGVATLPAGVTAAPTAIRPPAANPMYPDRYLKVLGFFPELDAGWYEGVHAVDFMAFAAPYMARYARNWIKDVEAGEAPIFRVITEIQYTSDAAKNEVRRLMSSEAGEPLLAHTMQHRAARRQSVAASAAAEPIPLFSVIPRTRGHQTPTMEASTLERQVLLLRRPGEASQSAFETAAAALTRHIERSGQGVVTSLDVFGTNPQAGPADAVAYVSNAGARPVPVLANPALRVLSVLRVETHTSIG